MAITMKAPAVTLVLLHFAFIFTFIQATSPTPQLQPPLSSFKVINNNTQASENSNLPICKYMVSIKTSCTSPLDTQDQIGITFGDAYCNKVYVYRLPGRFSRCSTDTFQIIGPCTNQTCSAHLYRNGNNGWKVQSVTISRPNLIPVRVYYDPNSFVPRGAWFGFDVCKPKGT